MLHHGVNNLKADRHSRSFMIRHDAEKFKVEDVKVSSPARDGYLLEQRLAEDGYRYGLNLLEQGEKLSHQLFSDLNVRMEFDEKEGEGLVNDGCELVSIDTEVVQEFEHYLEACRSQEPHTVTTPSFHDGEYGLRDFLVFLDPIRFDLPYVSQER